MKFNVEVRVSENFKREAKPLIKKFPSLKKELVELQGMLMKEPLSGNKIGNNAYKIRLAIKIKGKGKSGGARVITWIESEIMIGIDETKKTIVNLLSIYDKSDVDSISDKELKELIASSK